MRKINKKISLEPYKSRLPGVAPAISGSTFVDFIEPEHIRRGYGNYGLIPSDVEIPEEIASAITEYTDLYVNLKDADGEYALLEDMREVPEGDGICHRTIYLGGEEKMVLSYQTLMTWYRFMLEYEKLLDGNWCRSYSSATEYFDIQVGGSQIERERYVEMDRVFNARGGKMFFEWVSDNIIPTFKIPKDYVNWWGTSRLYYPDALMWFGWFDSRKEKYDGVTNCELTDSCCDCEEYFSRGGSNMWMLLDEWCKQTRWRIKTNNISYTKEASLNIPISLVRNVDNIGEMSMFSSEWEPGVDYGRTQDGERNELGTVSYYSGETYAIVGKQTGYKYNPEFMEIEFATDMWRDHTMDYINEHYSDFVAVESYAYNRHNVLIINPTDEKFTETFPYNQKESVLIGGALYDVVDGFWVAFKGGSDSLINGKRLQVEFSLNGVPYTVVNRRKYVARRVGNNYLFNFGTKDNPYTSQMVEGKFVKYGGRLYDVIEGHVDINGVLYEVIDGYFVFEDGSMYYVYNGELCNEYFYDKAIQEYSKAERNDWKKTVVNNNGTVSITFSYDLYQSRMMTGYTSNKSYDVMDKVISTDDIGKELPGRIVDKVQDEENDEPTFYQPSEGELLDIYFHVGNVTNLSYISDDEDGNNSLFNGDIITSMEFYYLDVDGKKIEGDNKEFVVVREMLDNGEIVNSGETTIELIDQLNEKVSQLDNVDVTKIYCDMTYHIGAILTGQPNGPLYGTRKVYVFQTKNETDMYFDTKRYSEEAQTKTIEVESKACDELISNEVYYERIYVKRSNGEYVYYPGIVYKDTLILEKDECFYNMSDEGNYPLNYYKVTVNAYDATRMNEMDDSLYTEHSYFETPILIYARENDTVEPDRDYYKNSNHFAKYNNVVASPMFRHDWQLGLSSRESSENDIYVDRGSVMALDKHLKLGEVKTMEALENYANGMLNIKQDQ